MSRTTGRGIAGSRSVARGRRSGCDRVQRAEGGTLTGNIAPLSGSAARTPFRRRSVQPIPHSGYKRTADRPGVV